MGFGFSLSLYGGNHYKKRRKAIDKYLTPFGIRSVKFDKDKGFFLNNKHLKLKGMCLHQDAGCLGTAVPDRLMNAVCLF